VNVSVVARNFGHAYGPPTGPRSGSNHPASAVDDPSLAVREGLIADGYPGKRAIIEAEREAILPASLIFRPSPAAIER
jgi:hypothetical protein